MGGITRRRANQVIRALREHELPLEEDSRLMLTDRGLTCLARRDGAAVRLILDRWSAQPAKLDKIRTFRIRFPVAV